MRLYAKSELAIAGSFAPSLPGEHPRSFRRYALLLIAFVTVPFLLLAAMIIAIDPYYVFGSPSIRGFNRVHPYYEPHVIIAKPYQVRRMRPAAVALGSSRVEVGIDPRHPGWMDRHAFNYALPSSNSYAMMLAFLDAQKVGSPLKQAVAGLDFFGFNINFPLAGILTERRFASGISEEFESFLDERYPDRDHRRHAAPSAAATLETKASWDEALYLAINGDVAAAVKRKEFKSGREHYELAGRAEGRQGFSVPAGWDEDGYLAAQPDVAVAVARRAFVSGYHHYVAAGRAEGRLGGFLPNDWNEADYLSANPDVRVLVALGYFRSGYIHYVRIGKRQGRLGGFPAVGLMEKLRLRWPALNSALFQLDELYRMVFSTTAVRDAAGTALRQSEPAEFDGAGMRVWEDHINLIRKIGGNGSVFYGRLRGGTWNPWLVSPKFVHCFSDPDREVTTFDPFRFMLRRAYAEGTDLRMFVTPAQAAIRKVFVELGLGNRYEYWLKEIVRINEEEAARAGKQPLPLWDFSAPSTINSEAIPAPGDHADAAVLGVFALPQGDRRSHA